MEKISQLRFEYDQKKEKIKHRLNEFRKFFNEPYSWIYADGDIALKRVNTSDNHRIFEELCFCIFTANTSAEMSAKAVDAVRDVLIEASAEEMSRRLAGIYRFMNKRPEYIVHTRNHLYQTINFRLKEILLSFRDKNMLRDFFALNKDIKGIGMKEASHFLRNLGFRGYAILDKHIINSLHEFGILKTDKAPGNKNEYVEAEERFKSFSKKINIDIDELDLLLWSGKNGRILK